MNLKPFARALAASLLALAMLILGATTAPAALPGQEKVPASALMAIGIADTGAFWTRAETLPIARAIDQYLANPQVATSLALQQFQLDRRKMEATLGYPATPAEFMKNVFSSFLIYGVPAAEPQGQPVISVVLGARDPAKAARLVEALDKRNAEAAAGPPAAPAPGQAAAAQPTAFDKVKLAGVQVSHLQAKSPSGQAMDFYYVLAGGRLLMTSSAPAMEQLIQDKAPAESLDKNPAFAQLAAALPWKSAGLVGWMDSAGLLMVGRNPMMNMVSRMGQSEKFAFAINVQADGIVGKVASTPPPAAAATIRPRKLAGVTYLAPAPLAGIVYGLLDPAQSYQQMNSFIAGLSLATQLQGGQAGGPVTNPLTALEQETGISIQNELVPALGHEVLVAVNSLQISLDPNQGAAGLDLVVGVEVADAAKMKTVMGKLERYLERKVAGSPMTGAPGSGQSAPAIKFQTLPGGIRTLPTGSPMLSPSYVVQNNYLLFSINPSSIQAAQARAAGRLPSAAQAPMLNELTRLAGTNAIYSFSLVNVAQISRTVLLPLLSMTMMMPNANVKMSPQDQQQATTLITDVLPALGTAASIESVQNGVATGYFKLKM